MNYFGISLRVQKDIMCEIIVIKLKHYVRKRLGKSCFADGCNSYRQFPVNFDNDKRPYLTFKRFFASEPAAVNVEQRAAETAVIVLVHTKNTFSAVITEFNLWKFTRKQIEHFIVYCGCIGNFVSFKGAAKPADCTLGSGNNFIQYIKTSFHNKSIVHNFH